MKMTQMIRRLRILSSENKEKEFKDVVRVQWDSYDIVAVLTFVDGSKKQVKANRIRWNSKVVGEGLVKISPRILEYPLPAFRGVSLDIKFTYPVSVRVTQRDHRLIMDIYG